MMQSSSSLEVLTVLLKCLQRIDNECVCVRVCAYARPNTMVCSVFGLIRKKPFEHLECDIKVKFG
jgi:hypothetical protein